MADMIVCNRCDLVSGDYVDAFRVEKLLGEGTFGQVYRVKGPDGKTYALKLLKLWMVEPRDRENLILRFDREFETGHIQSPFLAHSYSKGSFKNNPYIIMEYCPGGDLESRADEISLSKAAREVLLGLGDLHRQGKVHRDLKPENVLLRENGVAVLTDFGISGDQNNRVTKRGIDGIPKEIFGTFAFMPPEQINPRRGNATVLPTTDIFSFGVMMYFLLTKALPFGPLENENDLARYCQRGKDGKWNRDALLASGKGAAWLPVIEGCLVADYRRRLQTMQDVLARLPDNGGQAAAWKYGEYDSAQEDQSWQTIVHGTLLRVTQGEEPGRRYKLEESLPAGCRVLTMGRDNEDYENLLPVKEEESIYISRCHCTLEKNPANGRWLIRDGQWRKDNGAYSWKRSMNGTFVNSDEVDQNGRYLKIGDIVSIGDMKMRVEGW